MWDIMRPSDNQQEQGPLGPLSESLQNIQFLRERSWLNS